MSSNWERRISSNQESPFLDDHILANPKGQEFEKHAKEFYMRDVQAKEASGKMLILSLV